MLDVERNLNPYPKPSTNNEFRIDYKKTSETSMNSDWMLDKLIRYLDD